MDGFLVKRPGFLTTVQDKGRFGYQWSGLSPAGAMDLHSMRLANLLVGNEMDEAALEITIIGPTLEFHTDTVIAIAGADLSPVLDGVPLPTYQAVPVHSGAILSFGARRSGCRCYLAVAGGLDIPLILGSRSTLLRNAVGGVHAEGRMLKAGDQIGFRNPPHFLKNIALRQIAPEPIDSDTAVLRIIPGPQDYCFTEKGIDTFFKSSYTVTGLCNRQGYRLEGAAIEHFGNGNIVSDGIAMGAIQVPPNGQPIIMMSERQSTGGYPKIGTVITRDLPRVAQCFSGSHLYFTPTSIEEAQSLLREEMLFFLRLQEKFSRPFVRIFTATIEGHSYRAVVTPITHEGSSEYVGRS